MDEAELESEFKRVNDMVNRTYQAYTVAYRGYISKLLVTNSQNVYKYNNHKHQFELTTLEPNSEDDYIVINFVEDGEDKIGMTPLVFSYFERIMFQFREKYFYKRAYKKHRAKYDESK